MQTALHIYSLVRELADCIVGARFKGTEFFKKQREAYIHFKGRKGVLALGLVYHPHGYGTFLIPRGKLEVETPEKPWPFFQPALGGEVVEVKQVDFDRIFKIKIDKKGEYFIIVAEATGPNANFWLLNGENKIIATLRNRKYDSSVPYAPPPTPDRLSPLELETRHLIEIFRKSEQTVENILRKSIIGLDKYLIDDILTRALIDSNMPASEVDDDSIVRMESILKETVSMFEDYTRGYCYSLPDGNYAYPFRLRTLEEKSVRCKSLSFAVYHALRTKRAVREEFDEKQRSLDAVIRHVKRLKRKLSRIEMDLQSAANFEQYRRFAEILKVNLHSLKRGMSSVELEDIYSEDGGVVKIELNPAFAPAENADEYFRKYRKGKEALALLERRLEIAEKEVESAEMMQAELERDYDAAVKKYESEITALLPHVGERKAPAVRLPYKEYTLSTGITIYIGRDGADNDRTTFGHAKSYELWFHTAQCPSSHVVMKFPDKSFVPSKAEIAEAAAVTAYHSKARNSKTVPVIYTERKYVRKPRKAKPGLVLVEREKMIMVEPKKLE
jgi:predicted ribosome quality control (RQC) complex YloA/Tae2 family protein